MMSNEETKKIQGRLERRDRRVRDAVLLVAGIGSRLRPLTEKTPKCLIEVGGTPLVVRLLRQLSSAGIERAYLVTGYLSHTLEDGLDGWDGLPELIFVDNPTYDSFNNAESLRVAMERMTSEARGARPFVLADGDVLLGDEEFLGDLLSDPRPNVLAVELRLAHTLGAEEMKVQMEPVDVPWYTRRVVGLSKELQPQFCHGESIGVQVVGAETFGPLLEGLRALDDDERTDLYYEDVFARVMMVGHEFYTLTVPPGSFIEIDTVEDLEAARALAESWATELAG